MELQHATIRVTLAVPHDFVRSISIQIETVVRFVFHVRHAAPPARLQWQTNQHVRQRPHSRLHGVFLLFLCRNGAGRVLVQRLVRLQHESLMEVFECVQECQSGPAKKPVACGGDTCYLLFARDRLSWHRSPLHLGVVTCALFTTGVWTREARLDAALCTGSFESLLHPVRWSSPATSFGTS